MSQKKRKPESKESFSRSVAVRFDEKTFSILQERASVRGLGLSSFIRTTLIAYLQAEGLPSREDKEEASKVPKK